MKARKRKENREEIDEALLAERLLAVRRNELLQASAKIFWENIISTREVIWQSLLAIGADEAEVSIAFNNFKQAKKAASSYRAEEDFEGRRLKVALWSAEQAAARARRSAECLGREAESQKREDTKEDEQSLPTSKPMSLNDMISSAQARSEQAAAQAGKGRTTPEQVR